MDEIKESYHYQLTREIARGGMGAVYEAQLKGAEGFRKKVAVKVILDRILNDNQFEEMFIAEAKLVANLIHQNIAQVYQLGRLNTGDGSYYIAMEFINGVNLEEFLIRHEEKNEKVPVEIACFITSRVARGLSYAHRKEDDDGSHLNIVHRDVSLKNIMIAFEGEVKVTDFGIAKANSYFKDMEGEVLMGKAEYMSPEQARYEKTDGRSDIFSLGVVFYELLTNTNPFYNDDIHITMKNVINLEPALPSKLNPEVTNDIEKIILKAMAKDPEDRYKTAGEMLYALEFYMYHDRYGPTCETLADYTKKLFKGANRTKNDVTSDSETQDYRISSSTIKRKLLDGNAD